MTTKSEGMRIPGKLKWYAILALALWLAFSGVAAAEQLYVNESGWWRDGGMLNASGTPIQAAVDNATAGETICIAAGSYTGSVKISTVHLTLEGAGADVVTVTAANLDDHVFNVNADYVNISGFTVNGTTSYPYAGIYLNGADHCNVSENTASGNYFGIVLYSSSDNTLVSNTASNNFGGIRLQDSSNNMLESNNVPNNEYGIVLWQSSNNVLASNNVSNNDYGIIIKWHSSNNMLASNTANSNYYYGIRLDSSNNNTLASNTANSNNWGIWLLGSNNNTLASNTALSNYFGIRLDVSGDNGVTYNLLQNNTDCGIYLTSGSTGNTITWNSIVANGALQTDGSYQYQFKNSQSDTVDAIDNFWGFGMNNSTIDASIYDDEEDGWGEVEFYPFETEPAQCAPTPEEPPAFTTIDAVIALQIAAGSSPSDPRWDVNGDGSVTSLDALTILRAATDAIYL